MKTTLEWVSAYKALPDCNFKVLIELINEDGRHFFDVAIFRVGKSCERNDYFIDSYGNGFFKNSGFIYKYENEFYRIIRWSYVNLPEENIGNKKLNCLCDKDIWQPIKEEKEENNYTPVQMSCRDCGKVEICSLPNDLLSGFGEMVCGNCNEIFNKTINLKDEKKYKCLTCKNEKTKEDLYIEEGAHALAEAGNLNYAVCKDCVEKFEKKNNEERTPDFSKLREGDMVLIKEENINFIGFVEKITANGLFIRCRNKDMPNCYVTPIYFYRIKKIIRINIDEPWKMDYACENCKKASDGFTGLNAYPFEEI